ncbi:hypothetical protein ABEG72_20330 [Pantoea agglomerans]|uniref:hypothetical protein n=1 Tax=Enterobacter agglomerans TaxID=549 RepID=UPI003209F062
MDKLARLFKKSGDAQSTYRQTTDAQLNVIAKKCNRDEVAAIHIRLKLFRAELAACPEWDGDTQDQIWDAVETLKRLLVQIDLLRKP